MIREALELFQDSVENANGARGKVQLLDHPGDPNRYLLVDHKGVHQFIDKATPPRKHVLNTIDAFIEYVTWARDGIGDASPTVWFDGEEIRAILNDSDGSYRSDCAVCHLQITGSWAEILGLDDRWLPQKSFVRLLRIDLSDAATDSSRQLLRVARVLAFAHSQAGHGKVELGRQSIGRDIEEEVKSEAGDVPDEITLNARIFDDPQTKFRHEIRLAVDINPREGTFNLTPLPGSIEDAMEDQVEAIIGRLTDELVDVPVFRGRP